MDNVGQLDPNDEVTPQEVQIYNTAIQTFERFANLTIKDIEQLKEKFEQKGWFGLFVDCKVPEKDRWIFYFFTLSSSDRDAVCKDIEKFKNDIKDLQEKVEAIQTKGEEVSCNDVKELAKAFKEMVKVAKDEAQCTSSRTVHRMCRDIVSKKDDILKELTTMELVSSRFRAKQLAKSVVQSRKDLEESRKQNDELKEENEKLATRCSQVIASNEQLQEECRKTNNDFKNAKKDMQDKLQSALEDSEKLREECRELKETSKIRENTLENSLEAKKALEDKLKSALEDSGKLREECRELKKMVLLLINGGNPPSNA